MLHYQSVFLQTHCLGNKIWRFLVKPVPPEHMVGSRSYLSSELFSLLFRVCYHVLKCVLTFKFSKIISPKTQVFSDIEQAQ